MRVLHVFKDYFPPTHGGIEHHVHDLVHSLDGFSCCVLTSSRAPHCTSEEDDGVPVVRAAEYGRALSTPLTPAWVGLLRRLRPDLVHAHMPSPFGELALLAVRTPVPIVASYHADIVRGPCQDRLYRPLQQAFLRRAARIVVSSPKLAGTSPGLAGHRARLVTIPYGVDPAEWRVRPAAVRALRGRHPGPLVLFLGRLVRYKRLDLLIEAMRGVDATLLVVGDGPERQRLERIARRSGAESRVVFVGPVHNEDRPAYYHAADLFVLPSATRAEGFSIAMLEAMACGTPAVCTEVGTGTSWVNVHGGTGLVVPPGDASSLADAVRGLLGDGVRRREMGEAAAERVRVHFSKRAMLESTAELYRSVEARSPAGAGMSR